MRTTQAEATATMTSTRSDSQLVDELIRRFIVISNMYHRKRGMIVQGTSPKRHRLLDQARSSTLNELRGVWLDLIERTGFDLRRASQEGSGKYTQLDVRILERPAQVYNELIIEMSRRTPPSPAPTRHLAEQSRVRTIDSTNMSEHASTSDNPTQPDTLFPQSPASDSTGTPSAYWESGTTDSLRTAGTIFASPWSTRRYSHITDTPFSSLPEPMVPEPIATM